MITEKYTRALGMDYFLKEIRTWYWPFWRVEKACGILPRLYCYKDGKFVPAEKIEPEMVSWLEEKMKTPVTDERTRGYVQAIKEVWYELYGKWTEDEDCDFDPCSDGPTEKPVLPPLYPIHGDDDAFPEDGEEY